jgi:hypothetical protein
LKRPGKRITNDFGHSETVLYAGGSKSFKPCRQNLLQDHFYTSDYDLSSFQSFEPGLEMRFTGLQKKPASAFNNIGLRYSFYKRTDGLTAHTLTLLVDYFSRKK